MPLLVLLLLFCGLGISSKKIALVSVLFCGNFSGNKIDLVFFVKQFSPKWVWCFSLNFFRLNNFCLCYSLNKLLGKRLKFKVSGKVAVRCNFYSFHPMIS